MDLYEHFRGVFACIGPAHGPVRALGLQPRLLLGRIVVFLRDLGTEDIENAEKKSENKANTDSDERFFPRVQLALYQHSDNSSQNGSKTGRQTRLEHPFLFTVQFHTTVNYLIFLYS